MTNAELIELLRISANMDSDGNQRERLEVEKSIEWQAADALEASEARMKELELVNAQLVLELGNIETNTEQTQEAIRRIAHYRRGK